MVRICVVEPFELAWVAAKMKLGVAAAQLENVERVLSQFEEFCTVSQSVGQGIPIHTRVLDVNGVILKD